MNVAALTASASPASAASVSELAAARGTTANRKPLSGAALRAAGPEAQRSAVASQFEAILVRQLLNKTMSSMLSGESAGGGASANVYGDMLTDTFAQQLTSGRGLGLGRLLEKQLTPRGVPAAAATPAPATPATEVSS